MLYCSVADVRVHAPQAKSLDDAIIESYIVEMGGILEANMRSNYKVPLYDGVLNNVDQYVRTLVSKGAAGLLLNAQTSRKTGKVHEYGQSLFDDATAMIAKIKGDLTLIDSPLIEAGDIDDELVGIETAGDDIEPVFGLGDETTWGQS